MRQKSDTGLDFAGCCAWITGASRGIGLAAARTLASHGARVVALDLKTSAEITSIAEKMVEIDVADFAAVGAVATTLAGEGYVPDILVNNAGITRDAVVWKLSEPDWDAVLNVNLKGAFNLTRHAIPLMRQQQRGVIVNISSINGLRGKFGQSNYCAAKAGLIGFTKSVAREVGRFGIRVNAVAPGFVETEMTRGLEAHVRDAAINETLLGKPATPADIACAVLFLASPLARHITGHVLNVDGGQYL